MATDILDVYKSVYADGPSSSPVQPDKGRIRDEIGGGLQAIIDALRALFGLSVQWKGAVRAGSTSNVNLATIANGASFGGVTVATGNRFAAMGQTTASQNGIYVVQASGAPVRSTDADAGTEVAGMAFYVSEGTEGGRSFLCNTPGPITLGSTALSFVMIADQVALNAAIAALQALGLSGAIPANFEGIVYKLFGPGNAAALTSQGFWHNLVDKVPPRGELILDAVIDGTIYAIAWTDNTGQIIAGITKGGEASGGRVVVPGLIELLGSDDTYAGGFAYKDGTPFLMPRLDGKRPYIRGLLNTTGLPTLSHIPVLGQSNAAGGGQPLVTTTDQKYGGVMFRRGYHTWGDFVLTIPEIENRGSAAFELVPHREENYLATSETYATGLNGQLKAIRAGGRYAAADMTEQAPLLLYSYPHRGGRSMYELGPYGGYGHWEVAINDITQAKAQADAMGLDYGVPAMIYNQGEAESGGQMTPGGPFLGYNALVTAWKAQFADYWGQWDTNFRVQSGQAARNDRRIPVFIVQTVSTWTGQAQREVAREYREMFLATPQYFVPSDLNSEWEYISPATGTVEKGRGDPVHSAADSTRWLGAIIGKVIRRTLTEGELWRPLEMTDAERLNATVLRVKFSVPRPPLRWSADFDIGVPDHPTKGFQVFLGTPNSPGAQRTVTAVDIFDPDIVQITLDPATPIGPGATAYIVYGNNAFVRNVSVPIELVRAGANYSNGEISTEIVFNGDVRSQLNDMLAEGAFFLKNSGGASQGILDVRFVGGKTIARGETRIHDGDLLAGQTAQVHRDRPFGNLVDSDRETSIYDFADPRYGTRQGRPYPLNNWCCVGNQTVRT
ncbi:hypothetical protein [Pararhizobium sp.]|uniref:hypothetical protein n=1 Tax=Pararhizobium sp. TaxID=1977563 RepID=UPI003BA8ED68